MNSLFAIVLAAGKSSRYHGSKQLAQWQGEALVRHAVTAAEQICGSRQVLVVGDAWQEVWRAAEPLPGYLRKNDDYALGMGTSIACGVEAVAKTAAAVLIVLADQIAVDEAALRNLYDCWRENPEKIVCSRFAAIQNNDGSNANVDNAYIKGPPAIFPSRFFAELSRLDGDLGPRKLLKREDVLVLDCAAAAIDIDTVEDLRRFKRRHNDA